MFVYVNVPVHPESGNTDVVVSTPPELVTPCNPAADRRKYIQSSGANAVEAPR